LKILCGFRVLGGEPRSKLLTFEFAREESGFAPRIVSVKTILPKPLELQLTFSKVSLKGATSRRPRRHMSSATRRLDFLLEKGQPIFTLLNLTIQNLQCFTESIWGRPFGPARRRNRGEDTHVSVKTPLCRIVLLDDPA
jgi:hypothetical protein